MDSRYAAAASAVALLVVFGAGTYFLGTQSSGNPSSGASSISSTGAASPSSTLSSATRVGTNNYEFLIFMQKGIAELTTPDGTLLGYGRPYNISNSIPTQTFYWESYPIQGASQSNLFVPLSNGTIEVIDGSKMTVLSKIALGTGDGSIGVAVSPDERYAAVFDGPSGAVQVFQLSPVQPVWKAAFTDSSGATAFPSDIRWSPDGSSLVVPMRNNGTLDVISAGTGKIIASGSLPIASQPFMLSLNSQGNTLAVELSGNKTVAFYSYPALNLLGSTGFSPSSFSPARGLFTQDGRFYLQASGSTNVIEVVSTSTFAVVNTINLPSSGSPGLADMGVTPDGVNAYAVMHGTPATGGIIYLIPLATVSTTTVPSGSIPLTTAPAFVIPISVQFGEFLANYVLSPPVTGLHC